MKYKYKFEILGEVFADDPHPLMHEVSLAISDSFLKKRFGIRITKLVYQAMLDEKGYMVQEEE